jgi:hypothetical protein
MPERSQIAVAIFGIAEKLAEKRAWIVSVERRSRAWIPQDSYSRHSGPRLLNDRVSLPAQIVEKYLFIG